VRGLWCVLVVGLSTGAWAQDAGPSAIEAFEPFESVSAAAVEPAAISDAGLSVGLFEVPSAAGPTVHVYGAASAYTALDTRFDSQPGAALAENVWEGRARVALGVQVKFGERLRLVLEGRAQVRGATQRDWARAKGFFEPMLGEAFVDFYSPRVDLRVGNQRIALGANAALAPADALNPRDLRESLGEMEDAVLPVFAVRAQGEVRKLAWLVAYVPFFTPHRFFVFGQDEGLLQPALARGLDNRRVDPSVEDVVQERLLETQRPVPFAGDVALRVKKPGRVTLGASWVWLNERLPRVTVDPELQAVLATDAAGRSVDQAAAVSVLSRARAGQTLYRGFYGRQHLLSLEGSALLGPGQLDVDLTWTPRQTFVGADLAPLDKSALTWVISYSQATESRFIFAISSMGLVIPDVRATEQLVLLEPATVLGGARTGFFHLFIGVLGVKLLDERLELTLRAVLEVVQRSFTLAPRVNWKATERLNVYLAAEFFEGPAWSPFGYFDRNDRVVACARVDLF
jgi:hypothetical protein